MNNGISAYRSARAHRPQAAPAGAPDRSRPAAEPSHQTVRELQQARASADLSAEESAAIDRYFPPSDEMSMRIYGPDRKQANLNPGAVGGRLDIRG